MNTAYRSKNHFGGPVLFLPARVLLVLNVCQSIEEKDHHLTALLLLDKHFEIREFGFPTTAIFCEHSGSKASAGNYLSQCD